MSTRTIGTVNSGVFVDTFRNHFVSANTKGYWTTSVKAALFQNTIGSDAGSGALASPAHYQLAGAAYAVAPYEAGEVSTSGTQYAPLAISNPHMTTTASDSPYPDGALSFDCDDLVWGSVGSPASFTARACLLYHDDLSPKQAICLVNFGADFQVVSGIFTVIFGSTGVFSIDVTP